MIDGAAAARHTTPMELDLKSAIARRNISQTHLADLIGVNKSYISDLVSGKKAPSFGVLSDLVEALDAEPSELLRRKRRHRYLPAPSGPPGFAEGAATRFAPDLASNRLSALIDLVVPGLPNVIAWTVDTPSAGLGLVAGDVVLVESPLRPGSLAAGDIVVASVAGKQGDAVSVFARYLPPWIVNGSGASVGSLDTDTAILGRQLAVLRGAAAL
ncbi:MAG: helix-turn-helix domain-containing protein [Gemmobacter sp.]